MRRKGKGKGYKMGNTIKDRSSRSTRKPVGLKTMNMKLETENSPGLALKLSGCFIQNYLVLSKNMSDSNPIPIVI